MLAGVLVASLGYAVGFGAVAGLLVVSTLVFSVGGRLFAGALHNL